MSQITGGVVKYLRRVKTGEYEHKEAQVELSFNVGENQSYQEIFDLVSTAALTKVNQVLFQPREAVATPASEPTTEIPPPKVKAKGRPPKAAGAQLDPTDPRVTDPAGIPSEPADPAGIDVVTAQPEQPEPKAAVPDPAGLGDLLGDEAPKEITDKEITSAITQHQSKVNNGPAIRALVAEFAGPAPKMARDIPQEKRAAFLEKLVKVGPSGS